jgi:CHAT domain-containing protein/tetratricopeptide (TPR) repeat protein
MIFPFNSKNRRTALLFPFLPAVVLSTTLLQLTEQANSYDASKQYPNSTAHHLYANYRTATSENSSDELEDLESLLAIYRALENRVGEASTLHAIGRLHQQRGARDDAEIAYEQALSLYQGIGDRIGEATILVDIVSIDAFSPDNPDRSIEYLQRAALIYQESDNEAESAEALYVIGQFSRNLVKQFSEPRSATVQERNEIAYRLAIETFQEALNIYRTLGARQIESDILFDLGEVYRRTNDYSRALESYEETLQIRQEIGEPESEEIILYRIGQMHYSLGQYEQAIAAYHSGLEICKNLGENCFEYSQSHSGTFDFNTEIGDLYNRIGEAYFNLEQYELALGNFQEAVESFQKSRISANDSEGKLDFDSIYSNIFLSDLTIPELMFEDNYDSSNIINFLTKGQGIISMVNLALAYERLGRDTQAFQILNFITREENITWICEGYGDGARDHETLVDTIRADALQIESSDTEGTRCLTGFGTAHALQASIFYERKEYSLAVNYYSKAIEYFENLNDSFNVSLILNNLGVVYRDLGNYSQALSSYEEALELRQNIGDKPGEATTLNNIGELYISRGRYSQALEYYQAALEIFEAENNERGMAATYHNLGGLYDEINQHTLALDFYYQALNLRRRINDKQGIGQTFNNIGLVLEEEENFTGALDAYQQALIARQQTGNTIGEATTLNNIALLNTKIGQPERGLEFITQALNIIQQADDPAREGNMLDSLGTIYRELGRYEDAMQAYQQALSLLRLAESRSIERATLSHIGNLLELQGQPELAIVFYKQSVNLTEEIRADIRPLPQEFRQSYTDSVADTYRRLADLLLQADRVLEAQRVLDLLRVQELDEYLQDVQRNAQTETGAPLRPEEQEALQRFLANRDQLVALGRELRELEAIDRASRTPEQAERIHQLRQLQQDSRTVFNRLIDSPDVQAIVAQLRNTTGAANVELAELNALRDNLRRLEQNTVALYPLVLDDRLELVVVTPDAPPVSRTVEVRREDLNRVIANFRSALQDPSQDAVTPAQQLYDWLVRPIAADLAQANAEVILYSPDSQLRYIPLAALHDGDQWLTQRWQVNNIVAASLADLDNQSFQDGLSILAAAFTEGQYQIPISTRTLSFGGLEFAGREVENLAQLIPGTEKRLNKEFDQSLVLEMNDFNIIHLATHATFNPGPPEDSFIVFGDGSHATLRSIGSWDFPDVELVVLSACETALGDVLLGDDEANGAEILGLGYLMQQAGAEAAIASLWAVNDGGTQVLMDAFYAALNNGYSKAEALQRAQIALITSDETVLGGERGDGAYLEITDLRTGQPLEQSTDLAHPYYWAPFILIGNGL